MEKSHQEIFFEFLEKEIIVGEDILEIHSRHREGGNLAEDINKINAFITQNRLVIIKTRDDDTGLSYYMLSKLGRIVGKISRLGTPSGQNRKKTIFTILPLKF